MTDKPDPAVDERDDDVFAVRVKTDRTGVAELLRRDEFDYGDRPHITENPDGSVDLVLFVLRSQIDALRADGHEVTISSNQSARARERVAEVGTGDRFDGGRIPPTGLGRKLGGRAEPPRTASGPDAGASDRSS
jgi:FMN phosphatase YigB (HAD superfamily)